jgi:hypothetical protein
MTLDVEVVGVGADDLSRLVDGGVLSERTSMAILPTVQQPKNPNTIISRGLNADLQF